MGWDFCPTSSIPFPGDAPTRRYSHLRLSHFGIITLGIITLWTIALGTIKLGAESMLFPVWLCFLTIRVASEPSFPDGSLRSISRWTRLAAK